MSLDRFQRYLDCAGGDVPKACQLYAWNTAAAAAFYGPIQSLEIVLRNAIHKALASTYGQQWYSNTTIMRHSELAMAGAAQDRLAELQKPVTPGRVVAELGMGYWVGLFANTYDQSIWRTHLNHIFRPRPRRKDLHDKLDRIRTLRNRVTHHEPIFQRRLLDDYNRIEEVRKSLSQETWEWTSDHSRVLAVLCKVPAEVVEF